MPGPSTAPALMLAGKKRKSLGSMGPANLDNISTFSADSDTDKKGFLANRKYNLKDTTTIEGKLNIITQINGPREALCCKFNEEFDYLAAGYSDGVIMVFQSASGDHVFTLTDADVKDNRAPVTSIKHRPLSKVYPVTNCFTGTYANGCVKCWSYNFNQCLYTIKEKRQTFGIVYHPRFPKFVTFGDDLKVYFYDEESKTQERVLMASENPDMHDGHMSRVFAACFHPRNNYELITGGWDDVVQFWDLRQQNAIRHLSGVHMCGEGIDINPQGNEILTCSFQKPDPLQLWDYGSGKRIIAIDPDIHNSKLYCGRYASKDFAVAAGADPNIMRIVDLQTTATAANVNYLPGAVYSMDLGPPKKEPKVVRDKEVRIKGELAYLPSIAFVSGKKVFQVECY